MAGVRVKSQEKVSRHSFNPTNSDIKELPPNNFLPQPFCPPAKASRRRCGGK